MFLAVTPIEEFWDKDDELLFAGPWCALHDRRASWSGLRHRFLPDPWTDLERFRKASAYCAEFSARLLGQLAARLNELHGTDHDARYWRLLLDPWLTFHVEQMHDHHVLIEEAFALVPGLRAVTLDPACWETPRDMSGFVRLMIGDRFHLQLFSHLLAFRDPALPSRRLPPAGAGDPGARPLPGSIADPSLRRGLKALVKRASGPALRALGAAGAGRALISELGLTKDEQLKLVRKTGLRALPFYGELPEAPAPVFDRRRLGLAGLSGRDAFEKAFIAGLPAHFPTVYLEGYAEAVRATRARLPRAPKIVFSSLGWHYVDAFKYAAAECAARGSRLWGAQHGGSYGLDEFSSLERFERDVCDRYFAWGWSKLDGDPRLGDLPSPLLSRAAAASPGADVVFASMTFDLHNIRLIRDANGAGGADAMDRQFRFLRALPEPVKSRLLMRLYRHDWGWRHRERLLEAVPGVRFDDSSVPFSRRLREARLLVVDCPSTPMLEALAADVPCLMTWRPDTWTFRPSARPFLDAFRKAGLLFDSPEEAAAEAGRAYADPRAWWDEPARRAARLEFTRTFALTDKDWIGAWAREIRAGLSAV